MLLSSLQTGGKIQTILWNAFTDYTKQCHVTETLFLNMSMSSNLSFQSDWSIRYLSSESHFTVDFIFYKWSSLLEPVNTLFIDQFWTLFHSRRVNVKLKAHCLKLFDYLHRQCNWYLHNNKLRRSLLQSLQNAALHCIQSRTLVYCNTWLLS